MVIKTDHMAYLRSLGEASVVEDNPYSWAHRRIRELEAELAVRDNMGNEVLRILREATGKRDFHSEMEAAEWAAKEMEDRDARDRRMKALGAAEWLRGKLQDYMPGSQVPQFTVPDMERWAAELEAAAREGWVK